MRVAYVMKFVADMDAAVAFYRDTLGARPPREEHGVKLATFLDCEGAKVGLSS